MSYLVVAALETRHQLCLVVVTLLSALKRLFNLHFVVRGHVSVTTKRLGEKEEKKNPHRERERESWM